MDKPFVKVLWRDATDDDRTWLKEAEVNDFGSVSLEVISWGWLMKRTKENITLAADHILGTDTYGRVTKIPVGMLIKVEEYEQ